MSADGSGLTPARVCELPGCFLPAQPDHHFCGKSHAQAVMNQGIVAICLVIVLF